MSRIRLNPTHPAPFLIVAATGLTLAPRGSASRADLYVADVAPVQLPDAPGLDAHTAQGLLWRRLWLEPERLVAEFVGFARAEVRDADGAVVFSRVLAPDIEQHLLLDHLLPLVLARRAFTVLHGAVVHRGGRAVVLLGPTGAGKSTLTAYAWQHGWTVAGDDGAVLTLGHPPTVQATYPTIRLTPAAARLLDIVPEPGADVAGKHRVTGAGPAAFCGDAVDLATVVVLRPVGEGKPAEMTRLRGAAAHVALFSATFHVDLGGGPQLRSVVDELATLVGVVPIHVLSVPRGRDGLAAALQALEESRRG